MRKRVTEVLPAVLQRMISLPFRRPEGSLQFSQTTPSGQINLIHALITYFIKNRLNIALHTNSACPNVSLSIRYFTLPHLCYECYVSHLPYVPCFHLGVSIGMEFHVDTRGRNIDIESFLSA